VICFEKLTKYLFGRTEEDKENLIILVVISVGATHSNPWANFLSTVRRQLFEIMCGVLWARKLERRRIMRPLTGGGSSGLVMYVNRQNCQTIVRAAVFCFCYLLTQEDFARFCKQSFLYIVHSPTNAPLLNSEKFKFTWKYT